MLMKANGIDINTYGAELLNLDIQTAELENNYDWLEKSLSPILLKQKFKYKKITTEIAVKGVNREDVLLKASNLAMLLKKCILQFADMSMLYDCILTDDSINKRIRLNKINLPWIFAAPCAYKASIISSFTGKTGIINVDGNTETPAIVSVTMPIDTISVTLMGLSEDPIIIKNLHKDVPVIIDGEACTVMENNINKFSDTDLWQFPVLKPGQNNIITDNDNAKIQIQYKPRWI